MRLILICMIVPQCKLPSILALRVCDLGGLQNTPVKFRQMKLTKQNVLHLDLLCSTKFIPLRIPCPSSQTLMNFVASPWFTNSKNQQIICCGGSVHNSMINKETKQGLPSCNLSFGYGEWSLISMTKVCHCTVSLQTRITSWWLKWNWR